MKPAILTASRIRTKGPLLRLLQKKKRWLDRFFGINLDVPPLVLLSSRRQFNILHGKKTDDWMIAWAQNGVVFTLEPKIVQRTKSEYQKVIVHEQAHLYINAIGHPESVPKWLKEGLACWLAGQKKRVPNQPLLVSVFQSVNIDPKDTYAIGYFWVNLLLRRFGKKKLLSLIQKLDGQYSLARFQKTFRVVYGFSWSHKLLAHKRFRLNSGQY